MDFMVVLSKYLLGKWYNNWPTFLIPYYFNADPL